MLDWVVAADGHKPIFGDERAFPDAPPPRVATVRLERGWGARLWFRETDPEGARAVRRRRPPDDVLGAMLSAAAVPGVVVSAGRRRARGERRGRRGDRPHRRAPGPTRALQAGLESGPSGAAARQLRRERPAPRHRRLARTRSVTGSRGRGTIQSPAVRASALPQVGRARSPDPHIRVRESRGPAGHEHEDASHADPRPGPRGRPGDLARVERRPCGRGRARRRRRRARRGHQLGRPLVLLVGAPRGERRAEDVERERARAELGAGIRGRVVLEEDARPAPGFSVELVSRSEVLATAVTGADGRFSLPSLGLPGDAGSSSEPGEAGWSTRAAGSSVPRSSAESARSSSACESCASPRSRASWSTPPRTNRCRSSSCSSGPTTGSARRSVTDARGAFSTEAELYQGELLLVPLDHPTYEKHNYFPFSYQHDAATGGDTRVRVRVGPTYELALSAPPSVRLEQLEAELVALDPRSDDEEIRGPVRPGPHPWVRFRNIQWEPDGPPWRLRVVSKDGLWAGEATVETIAGAAPEPVAIELAMCGALRGRGRRGRRARRTAGRRSTRTNRGFRRRRAQALRRAHAGQRALRVPAPPRGHLPALARLQPAPPDRPRGRDPRWGDARAGPHGRARRDRRLGQRSAPRRRHRGGLVGRPQPRVARARLGGRRGAGLRRTDRPGARSRDRRAGRLVPDRRRPRRPLRAARRLAPRAALGTAAHRRRAARERARARLPRRRRGRGAGHRGVRGSGRTGRRRRAGRRLRARVPVPGRLRAAPALQLGLLVEGRRDRSAAGSTGWSALRASSPSAATSTTSATAASADAG